MTAPLKLLLLGDSDSQLLACSALCRFPATTAVSITVNAIPRKGTPKAVLDRVAALGELWRLETGQLLSHPELLHFDAIGVFLTGSKIADFRHRVSLLPGGNRPVLFCGFNGVVLERFEEAISWRLGYDLICLNGPRDKAALDRLLQGTPFSDQAVVITGLGRNDSGEVAGTADGERPRRLVFAEQVVMPARAQERQRMVRVLAELARRSPDWEVVIRPRIAPDEATFHQVKTHISQTLLETLGHPPINLRLDYTPMPQLLEQARLLATVSSTAFFDALDHGCKPLVMADFGMGAGIGSHVFAGSGVSFCLNAVDDLDSLDSELSYPSPGWLDWMGYGHEHQPGKLLEAIATAIQGENPLFHLDEPGFITNAYQPANLQEEAVAPTSQSHRSHLPLDEPGYMSDGDNPNFNKLRLGAEAAIQQRNYAKAVELLELAMSMRPNHRNLARRLWAVRSTNRLSRRLRLLYTPRFVG